MLAFAPVYSVSRYGIRNARPTSLAERLLRDHKTVRSLERRRTEVPGVVSYNVC
jgi:hypothetical protein